ncbi:MAG: hypothetical protein JW888_05080, partial [Pirellulales bacterium]|nr:hypothetical protein [Pirellulales bacterium]
MVSLLSKLRRLHPRATTVVLAVFVAIVVTTLGGVLGDTWTAPTSKETATTETTVYRVGPGESEPWAGQPRREYAKTADGRIVSDVEGHGLGVSAPPASRERMAAEYRPETPPTSTPSEPRPSGWVAQPVSPTSHAAQTVRQPVNLWNVSAAEFETNLLHAVGDRLMSRRHGNGVHEYLLPLPDGQPPRLRVEPRGNRVSIEGHERPVRGAVELVHALDSPRSAHGVRFVTTPGSREDEVRRLIHAVQLNRGHQATRHSPRSAHETGGLLVAANPTVRDDSDTPSPASPEPKTGSGATPTTTPGIQPPTAGSRGVGPEGEPADGSRLVGPVQVQVLEGLDAIIIKGRPEDVKRVQELIEQIEQYSQITKPAVEVVMLKHADASALGALLKELYEEVYAAREGLMSITPLAAPNALLLIGRPESAEKLMTLIERLDQPVSPTARFRLFHLKHVPAEKAQESI